MTDASHRLYAVLLALVVFLVTWAAIASRPWATAAPDQRVAALSLREQRLRADAKIVQQVVAQRMAAYRAALERRQAEISKARSLQTAPAAPATTASVRIVQLPPLTITRTS